MKAACRAICFLLVSLILTLIVGAMWQMLEIALYGTSQQSIVDTFMGAYLSADLAYKLVLIGGGKEE